MITGSFKSNGKHFLLLFYKKLLIRWSATLNYQHELYQTKFCSKTVRKSNFKAKNTQYFICARLLLKALQNLPTLLSNYQRFRISLYLNGSVDSP